MKKLNNRGISLIEVLCSGAILAIVSLMITSGFISNLEVYKKGTKNYKDVNSYVNEIESETAIIDNDSKAYIKVNGIKVNGNYRYTKDQDENITMAEFVPEKNSIPDKPDEPGVLSKDIFICAWKDGLWALKPLFDSNWDNNWIKLNGQGVKGDEYIILDGYVINVNKNWDDVIKEAISSQGTHIIKGDVYKDYTGVYVVKNDQWVSKYSANNGITVSQMGQNVQRVFTEKVWMDKDYSYSDWYKTHTWNDLPVFGSIYIPNTK